MYTPVRTNLKWGMGFALALVATLGNLIWEIDGRISTSDADN